MKRSIVYVLGCMLAVMSCVTEYQPETVSISPALVIEGQITDQPGPYYIKLTRTTDYTIRSLNLLETGAVVTIEDNLGNRETLTEQAAGGTYQTRATGIQGMAGRSYKLTIQTKNGKRYGSDAEVLQTAPPIQQIYAEYTNEGSSAITAKNQGWNVYIDTKDPETPGNFYRWDWTHYEFTEVCFTKQLSNGTLTGLGCCSPCWDITRCYNCINVTSDININGQNISRQLITRVPFTSLGKYYLEVQQQAISKGAYAFWKSVRQLTSSTGGLFDAAPQTVQGNVHCLSDPTEMAYGYFGATGIAEQHIYVDRSAGKGSPTLSPFVSVPQPSACVTCVNNQYRTPNQPRWWVY